MSGRSVGWILLALAGLAVAVALSVTASSLSTQDIGLSGEPLRAGDRLAPATATRAATPAKSKKRAPKRRKPGGTTTTTTPTVTEPTPTTTDRSSGRSGSDDPAGDDHGGSRESRDADDD